MKRVLLFFAVFVFSFSPVSRAQEAVDSLDLDAFWETICALNENYQKYLKDNSKFKEKCQAEFFVMASQGINFSSIDTSERKMVTALNRILAGKKNAINRFALSDMSVPNAFVSSSGAVFVTESLVDMVDFEELLGILGHEIAHYKLLHAEVNYYAKKKKERKNEVWAAIGTGLYAAANAVGPALSASAGMSVSQNTMNQMNYNNQVMAAALSGIAAENAENYGFKYSRAQEIEADMAAANLLDYVGIGRDKLISAFKKLQAYEEAMGIRPAERKKDRKKDTHPTMGERIFILENYQTINDYLAAKK